MFNQVRARPPIEAATRKEYGPERQVRVSWLDPASSGQLQSVEEPERPPVSGHSRVAVGYDVSVPISDPIWVVSVVGSKSAAPTWRFRR